MRGKEFLLNNKRLESPEIQFKKKFCWSLESEKNRTRGKFQLPVASKNIFIKYSSIPLFLSIDRHFYENISRFILLPIQKYRPTLFCNEFIGISLTCFKMIFVCEICGWSEWNSIQKSDSKIVLGMPLSDFC